MLPEPSIPNHLHPGAVSPAASPRLDSLLHSPGTAAFSPLASFTLHEQVCFLNPGNKEEHKGDVALSLKAV